jgi:phage shock protein A
MGTELERRIERLSAAVLRLEEAAAAASPAESLQNQENLLRELAAVKDENDALRRAHEAVMGRLDMTIARLRDALGG